MKKGWEALSYTIVSKPYIYIYIFPNNTKYFACRLLLMLHRLTALCTLSLNKWSFFNIYNINTYIFVYTNYTGQTSGYSWCPHGTRYNKLGGHGDISVGHKENKGRMFFVDSMLVARSRSWYRYGWFNPWLCGYVASLNKTQPALL